MRRRDGQMTFGRGTQLACCLAVTGLLLTSCAQWRERVMPELNGVGTSISDFFSNRVGASGTEPAAEGPGAMAIQRGLKRLGYNPGVIDGLIGARTVEAIKRYQRDRGLAVDGKVTMALGRRIAREAADAGAGREIADRIPPTVPSRAPGRVSPDAEPQGEPFVSLPFYRVGTSFVYSDGAIDRVTQVEGGRIKWTSENGTTFTAEQNFLLPWAYWETELVRGRTTITNPKGRSGASLWPDKVGIKVAFGVEREVVRRSGPERILRRFESWRCVNEARIPLDVTAGKFDTLKLVCEVGRNDGTSALLVWYYAPKIGHYVRHERSSDGEAIASRELVAMRPTTKDWPPLARAGLEKEVVNALSSLADSGVRVWRSRGVDAKVTLKVVSRYVGRDGESCRTYVQKWEIDGEVRIYPGAACRASSGVWRLPVDTNGAKAFLGITAGP